MTFTTFVYQVSESMTSLNKHNTNLKKKKVASSSYKMKIQEFAQSSKNRAGKGNLIKYKYHVVISLIIARLLVTYQLGAAIQLPGGEEQGKEKAFRGTTPSTALTSSDLNWDQLGEFIGEAHRWWSISISEHSVGLCRTWSSDSGWPLSSIFMILARLKLEASCLVNYYHLWQN